MRYLQVARTITLGKHIKLLCLCKVTDTTIVSCWLLSAIALGTSGKLNAVSTPSFKIGDLLFPFVMGIISCVLVYPLILHFGRPRKSNSLRRLYLPPFIEFPLMGVWALVWGGAAHVDTAAWYPEMDSSKFTWMHCDAPTAHGVVDPKNGLVVSSVCNILRTAHGCSWLIPLITAIGMVCMGVPYLCFLWTRGWTVTVWTPISEGRWKRETAIPQKEKETSSV